MTDEQTTIFILLGLLLALLIWGRWRYDLVSVLVLAVAVVLGLVPAKEAFSGFGHPATVTVAMVLVISRALSGAGAMDQVVRRIESFTKRTSAQIACLSLVATAMSGFMNNVGALGLLMPAVLKLAKNAKRSASPLLMPVSFASILGGLVTLIGTPPNIIIATIRADLIGETFGMFDFSPVGLAVAAVGLCFVALVGWRLVPQRQALSAADELFDIESYVAELSVPEGATAQGKRLSEIETLTQGIDVLPIGLIRDDQRFIAMPRRQMLRAGDVLVVEAGPEALDAYISALGLEIGTKKSQNTKSKEAKTHKKKPGEKPEEESGPKSGLFRSDREELAEAVIAPNSRLIGRGVASLGLPGRFGVNLLGVSRQGQPHRGRLASFRFKVGDIILLHGEAELLPDTIQDFGCLPLAASEKTFGRRGDAVKLVSLFAAAIGASALGFVAMPIALMLALGVMVASGLIPLRNLYNGIDWPVIVLLGALIPVGGALQSTGATAIIAQAILDMTQGYGAVLVLTLVLVVTMTLSDILNNAATAVVMAPIGVTLAGHLSVNPDAFLMAVAVGASCAFLTPIGHQNNAMIMGPGGYHFSDYWRLGLPLEILIVVVAVPMILLVWPLT